MYQSNTPKAYQQGFVEFYKLKFKVTPDVLIPRPETELLVDEVIEFVDRESSIVNRKKQQIYNTQPTTPDTRYTILDIGTGSGAIAIAIAKNIPDAKITATDISRKALEVAKQNAKFHQVEKQIEFIESNLLEDIDKPYQVIVTNLPYIPSARIPYLDPSVKDYEPHIALDGGEDGFELYRKLFLQIIKKNLYPKVLIGEIDYTHSEIAKETALKYFPKAEVQVKTDLTHKQRVLVIKF